MDPFSRYSPMEPYSGRRSGTGQVPFSPSEGIGEIFSSPSSLSSLSTHEQSGLDQVEYPFPPSEGREALSSYPSSSSLSGPSTCKNTEIELTYSPLIRPKILERLKEAGPGVGYTAEEIADQLPNADADREQIKRALRNLLSESRILSGPLSQDQLAKGKRSRESCLVQYFYKYKPPE